MAVPTPKSGASPALGASGSHSRHNWDANRLEEVPKVMADIARLKITLDGVKPKVLRRIEVPLDIKLDVLHLAFQIAIGWENYHFFEFRAGDMAWGIADPHGSLLYDPLPAKKATLAKLLDEAGTTFQYAYDFGDGWQHTVTLEAIGPVAEGAAYPLLIAAEGRCPPEDVGRPWGYDEYLKAIGNRRHARHAEMIEWRGPGFDPAVVDVEAIEEQFADLAKRLARRKSPAKKRQRP
jgi:hypothetical protein